MQQFFNSIITFMLAKFILNDVPHATGLGGDKWSGIQKGHELARKTLKGRGIELSSKQEVCSSIMDFWDDASKHAITAGELYSLGKKREAIEHCSRYYGVNNVAFRRRIQEQKLTAHAAKAGVKNRHAFILQFIPDVEIQTLADLFSELVSLMKADTDVITVDSYASEIDGFCVAKSYDTYHQCIITLEG